MMDIMATVAIAVLSGAFSGAGIYAAVRADLARAIVTADHAYAFAEKAHGRIDDHMVNRK